jgi:hypothetical protein
MKKYHLLCCMFLATLAQAQLANNGATIVIQAGGSIFCAGNFTNASGTITNDGKIEVQGNFANSGSYNSTTGDDSLIMSGSGNATLNSGGATFRYLTVNKGSNMDVVTLGGTVTIGNKLDYLAGVLSTDYLANPSYFLSAPGTAIFNFAAGREIAGNVKRTGWSNGSTLTFNSANMQVTTNGGTAPSEFTVTMLPEAYGGNPSQAEREVKRKFLFTPNGRSDFTTNIRFPYATAELNTNTEDNLVPWNLVSSEWHARVTPVSRDGVNDWVSTTGVDVASLGQEWKLADPRYTFNVTAYLRGPWNGAGMNASINSILPTAQPYNTTPFNYPGTESVGAIPNGNVVDWVLVELRKPASGLPLDASSSTIIGRKAGFLLKNGTVVDLDGSTPIQFDISKQGAAFVAIRHRNHLGVLSLSIPSNPMGSFANNFSTLGNVYKNPSATSDPATSLPSSVLYGLWSGDVNRSNSVNSLDVNSIKTAISNLVSGYVLQDVNLNGGVNSLDLNQSKATISTLGQSSLLRSNPTRNSSLPD